MDCKDSCPKDRDNDIDRDSVCGDVDACPLDDQNDADDDELCANEDPCPRDPGWLVVAWFISLLYWSAVFYVVLLADWV